MKVCILCEQKFESSAWECPACYQSPVLINNHFSFAPQLAEENEHYPAEIFSEIAPLEAANFWFRSRNRIITWALQKYFPDMQRFLEIGCGTGYVLNGVREKFKKTELHGSEIHSAGLSYATQRLSNVELFQMDARTMPFEAEYDVIGAFDVLEHIEEDTAVLAQIYRALKPGGGLVITVPQHPLLWSEVDTQCCHVRRYTAKEMCIKLEMSGFKLLKMSSFVFLLLPFMVIARFKKKRASEIPQKAELQINRILNNVFEKIMSIEFLLIQIGCNLPLGGSLLIVAQK